MIIGFIITLFGYSLLCGGHQDEGDVYETAKVIAQIVDPETGEPVKEPFLINIFYSKDDKYPANLYRCCNETDNRGKIELELPPYIYYLQFYPVSPKSKYCMTPNPYRVEEKERDVLRVEPGKITYFKKKAIIGGILKLYIADMNDVRFNPQEKFNQEFNISSNIVNDFYMGGEGESGDLNDGVETVYGLYEAMYRINIEFEGLGFKNFRKTNILVEHGKTTEVVINLDLTDVTGVEGFVTDASGVPVEGAIILFGTIEGSTDDTIGYEATANKDGYYRLTGMPEGKYYLSYIYVRKIGRGTTGSPLGYFETKKNELRHLDIQLKRTIAEMENN